MATELAIMTKQGLLILPQNKDQVSIVSVGDERVRRLPALVSGPGRVVIRKGREEEVFDLEGEEQSIRYLHFNSTQLEYLINGPEGSEFLPEILSENVEEITTIVTLALQVGSIPLLVLAGYRVYQLNWCWGRRRRRSRSRDRDDIERGEEVEMVPPSRPAENSSSRSNRTAIYRTLDVALAPNPR